MFEKEKIIPFIKRNIWFAIKPIWLFFMFLLGLTLILALPLAIFEYSFSASELDVMECAFVVYLVIFTRNYILHCRSINAPRVRKIITPFVNFAHMNLLFTSVIALVMLAFQDSLELLLTVPIVDLGSVMIEIFIELIEEATLIPLFDLIFFFLSVLAFQYSFHKVSSFSYVFTSASDKGSNQKNFEGATIK